MQCTQASATWRASCLLGGMSVGSTDPLPSTEPDLCQPPRHHMLQETQQELLLPWRTPSYASRNAIREDSCATWLAAPYVTNIYLFQVLVWSIPCSVVLGFCSFLQVFGRFWLAAAAATS
mgnify:CR=1 FL=1